MSKIRIAIVGVGNCASALVQGIHYCRAQGPEGSVGLMNWEIGGYSPADIEVVAAIDIDGRKVGHDLAEAIFSPPNCTRVFFPGVPHSGVRVIMGRICDGVSGHMQDYPADQIFVPAAGDEATAEEIVAALTAARAEILLNFLPVGSEDAARFYAECALKAGTALINAMPTFIASDPVWADRFREQNLPVIGDDIKSQIGATIVHRTLTNLFRQRGVTLDRTYQLNTGGNTDFLNMQNSGRLSSKKRSKTEAVQSVTASRLPGDQIHIGPSDYVPWQKDNKVAFIRMEGRLFADTPMNIELRLSVEDSPNSAGVVIDAIRCCRLALDRGTGGVLLSPSSFFMKHPPEQCADDEALKMTEEFIAGHRSR
jgi:myo-inositol-1-phosphate synthase